MREFVIARIDGVQVGFTGLAPANTRESSSPGPYLQVLGYAEAMRDVLPKMRAAGGQVAGFQFTRHEITEQTPADPAIGALMKQYNDKLSLSLNQVIGSTAVTFDARKAANRLHETLLGDFIADVTRQSVGAEVGFINGGNIRAERYYLPGPLTKKDVIDILPFTNYIVKLAVSGEALLAALENGVSQMERGAGRFPQVSGVSFMLDPTQPAGQRVSEVRAGGKPLDLAATPRPPRRGPAPCPGWPRRRPEEPAARPRLRCPTAAVRPRRCPAASPGGQKPGRRRRRPCSAPGQGNRPG